MARYIFDLEADGLLDTISVVHSLVIQDADTGEVFSCADQDCHMPIGSGLRRLIDADEIIGHNIIDFDIPALQKVYPWFSVARSKVTDTLVLSRLIYSQIGDLDARIVRTGKMPGKLFGSHSLKAWGYRLGLHKGDYAEEMEAKGLDPWAVWSPEMQSYCELDVEVTNVLLKRLEVFEHYWKEPQTAIKLEHETAWLMAQQRRNGFGFDTAAAHKLYAELAQEQADIRSGLDGLFPDWFVWEGDVKLAKLRRAFQEHPDGLQTKRVKPKGEKAYHLTGWWVEFWGDYTKVKTKEFNPGSRQQIADRLMKLRGWKPTVYTERKDEDGNPAGQPKVDEKVLKALPYPEAQTLARYFLLSKRLGQLAEGDQAWLNHVTDDGFIHGYVNPNGAVTGRATHGHPNIAQVPKVSKGSDGVLMGEAGGWGWECRSLFIPPKGFVLLGSDQDGLELRCLAGFMALYDQGSYVETVLKGDKSQGTDIHSVNCRALGLDPKESYNVFGKQIGGRDIAKTWF